MTVSCVSARRLRISTRLREDEQPGAGRSCKCRRQSDTKAQWTSSFQRRILVPMVVKRSLVTVVDDDESMRESLPDLLLEFGYAARAFSSAEEFLASDCLDQTNCLILDVAMPGMTGPDLQHELRVRQREIPIIFITANRDETIRARVLEQGAEECLFKPFGDSALFVALQSALSSR
jgi:CheY-like chemotaxis protein